MKNLYDKLKRSFSMSKGSFKRYALGSDCNDVDLHGVSCGRKL